MVTNQRHVNVELGDEIIRTVLSLLDGSRNRRDLARDLLAAGMDPGTIDRTIEQGLEGLRRLGLLTS
jgi:hypothetical protein